MDTGINKRLKELREIYLHLSQRAFSEKLGISQTAVALFEKCEREVKEVYIRRACDEFNISYEWLRYGIGKPRDTKNKISESDQYVAQLLQDRKTPFSFLIKEIMHTYNELDDKSQEAFNSFLSKLIFNISSSVVDDTLPMSKDDENAFWQGLAAEDKEYWENHNVAAANGNVGEKEFIDISGVMKAIDNDED